MLEYDFLKRDELRRESELLTACEEARMIIL